jgi:hypothetical protein
LPTRLRPYIATYDALFDGKVLYYIGLYKSRPIISAFSITIVSSQMYENLLDLATYYFINSQPNLYKKGRFGWLYY